MHDVSNVSRNSHFVKAEHSSAFSIWGRTLESSVTFPRVFERKRKQPAKATCQTRRKQGIISEMRSVMVASLRFGIPRILAHIVYLKQANVPRILI